MAVARDICEADVDRCAFIETMLVLMVADMMKTPKRLRSFPATIGAGLTLMPWVVEAHRTFACLHGGLPRPEDAPALVNLSALQRSGFAARPSAG